jgi:pimeloyl-ACP methyl ester carboxylesterase
MHGFPDNLHIYDDLVPHLVSAGRRTVAFDFLGFGASDKPAGAQYSFAQQLGDLEAVVESLDLDKVIPVGHDAAGPAAVNFALKHPECTAAVTLMDAFRPLDSQTIDHFRVKVANCKPYRFGHLRRRPC